MLSVLTQSVYSFEPDTSSYSLKQQTDLDWDAESLFCPNDQTLILKASDESPACVYSESKEKLLERGWAILTLKDRLYDVEKFLNQMDCVEFGRWLDEFADGNYNDNLIYFDLPVSESLSERIFDFIPYCIEHDNDDSFYLNTKHFIDFKKLDTSFSKPISVEGEKEEHYNIEIVGLKEEYVLGEEYSFYFIISGYGHECARIILSYPDHDGNMQGWGQEPMCDPDMTMQMFEINPSENRGPLFGNIALKNPGTYAVTITFDKPSKYYPTMISKEFRVVES